MPASIDCRRAGLVLRPQGRSWLQAGARLLLAAALVASLSACAPRQLLLHQLADELASQGQAPEDDLLLARDAAPFYLKLSESVLLQTPAHGPLAAAVAAGFTQYAYAFVDFEADRLAPQDARAAQRQRARAARLYLRAHQHAMAALQAQTPRLRQALATAGPVPLAAGQVDLAYWAAAAWAAHIALSTDRPEVVADLPLAQRLAAAAFALQPTHGSGALASLMGTLEAARPGGSPQRAQAYFSAAAAAGAGRNAGVFVAQAESLALPAGDRAGFEALLRQALAAADLQPDLANTAMRARAQWLLDSADDLF